MCGSWYACRTDNLRGVVTGSTKQRQTVIGLFTKVVYALTVQEFEDNFANLEAVSPAAADWLRDSVGDSSHWYMHGGCSRLA